MSKSLSDVSGRLKTEKQLGVDYKKELSLIGHRDHSEFIHIGNVGYILFVVGSLARPSIPINKKPNLVGKPGETGENQK